ncbi:MAG: class I SAM-dependent methyltransferase [Candidatus Bathyarchaeota archaeon]
MLHKVPQLKNMLSLDIGAGSQPKGTINVDVRPVSGIDVVCAALHLPFRKGTFDHVYLSHVIEHLHYKMAVKLIEEVNYVLKVGGKIEIWAPNFLSLSFLNAWIFARIEHTDPPMLYAPICGLQDYEENTHLSQWTAGLLRTYVSSKGFDVTYAKTEGTYRGKLRGLHFFIKIFPSRGGAIHLIATKKSGILQKPKTK